MKTTLSTRKWTEEWPRTLCRATVLSWALWVKRASLCSSVAPKGADQEEDPLEKEQVQMSIHRIFTFKPQSSLQLVRRICVEIQDSFFPCFLVCIGSNPPADRLYWCIHPFQNSGVISRVRALEVIRHSEFCWWGIVNLASDEHDELTLFLTVFLSTGAPTGSFSKVVKA